MISTDNYWNLMEAVREINYLSKAREPASRGRKLAKKRGTDSPTTQRATDLWTAYLHKAKQAGQMESSRDPLLRILRKSRYGKPGSVRNPFGA